MDIYQSHITEEINLETESTKYYYNSTDGSGNASILLDDEQKQFEDLLTLIQKRCRLWRPLNLISESSFYYQVSWCVSNGENCFGSKSERNCTKNFNDIKDAYKQILKLNTYIEKGDNISNIKLTKCSNVLYETEELYQYLEGLKNAK